MSALRPDPPSKGKGIELKRSQAPALGSTLQRVLSEQGRRLSMLQYITVNGAIQRS